MFCRYLFILLSIGLPFGVSGQKYVNLHTVPAGSFSQGSWYSASGLSNNSYTYQVANYANSYSRSDPSSYLQFGLVVCRDSVGNQLFKSTGSMWGDNSSFYLGGIDHNHVAHVYHTSRTIGTTGLSGSTSYSLMRFSPGGPTNDMVSIGSEMYGHPDPQIPDRTIQTGQIMIDQNGNDYLTVSQKQMLQSNGNLIGHQLFLLKYVSGNRITWRKYFADTGTTATPNAHNNYKSLGCHNNVLYVEATLQNDSFLYDGSKHKAQSGHVMLRFDTSGTYLGYCTLGNYGISSRVVFDGSGNMVFVLGAVGFKTIQLDTIISVSTPALPADATHALVVSINPITGTCVWHHRFFSTGGEVNLSVQTGGAVGIIVNGLSQDTLLLNGVHVPMGNETFRGIISQAGSFTLSVRKTVAGGGVVYPLSAWQNTAGNWLISDFVKSATQMYGCDSAVSSDFVAVQFLPSASLYPAPVQGSSQLSSTGVWSSSVRLKWKNGDGRARIVLARESFPVNAIPVNGQNYIASATFGSGAALGINNFVVYNGKDTTVLVTGLKPNTTYSFKIIEYNGCDTLTNYAVSGDTLSITTPFRIYYSKAVGNIHQLSTWGQFPDGTGTSPLSFAEDSTIFILKNVSQVHIPIANFAITGRGSTFIVGDSISQVHLQIDDTVTFIVPLLKVLPHSMLTISGKCVAQRLQADSLSEVRLLDSKQVPTSIYTFKLVVKGTANVMTLQSVYISDTLHLDGKITATFFMLGTDSLHPGALDYKSGWIHCTFNLLRYYPSTITTGNAGFIPLALYNSVTQTVSERPLNIRYTTAPQKGGLLRILYSQGNTVNDDGLPVTDTTGADTVLITRMHSTILTLNNSGIVGGKLHITLSDSNTNRNLISELRLMRRNSSNKWLCAGNYTSNSGSALFPIINSTEIAALTNGTNTFAVGIDDTSMYKYLQGKPTQQSQNFRVEDVLNNQMLLKWKRGNGYQCMVIARRLGPVNALPVDSVNYTAWANFGTGSNLGNQNFVVYKGTLDSVWVTGLFNNTRYYFAVLEYNGYPGNERYLTSPLTLTTDSTRSFTHYYNKPGLSISQLGAWGMKPDGTGDTLTSFLQSNALYNLVNGSTITLSDSLWISPKSNNTAFGSRFNIGNNIQPIVFTIAQGAKLLLGTNINITLAEYASFIVNGAMSCKTINHSSSQFTALMELNSSEMIHSISPVYTTSPVWTVPKLKVRGKHYYDLPYIQVIDSCEIDAVINGTLVMNNRLSGMTFVDVISGGATNFGHIFNTGVLHYFPTILIDNTSTGYSYRSRPIQMKCTHTSAICNDPFIVQCRNNLPLLPLLSGFPLTDSSAVPLTSVNKLYPSNTSWTGSFGFYSITSCSDKQLFDVHITDTLLPGISDTHALAVWTHVYHPSSYPVQLYGNRVPYFINNGKITAARSGVYFVWSQPFGAITFGLAIDSSRQQLPVSWLSFTGNKQNEDVVLKWTTASEQNNSHFEIERSTDGFNFTYVGREKGNGTTNSINGYGFTDRDAFSKALADILYYRLKQVDYNGDFEYSRTIAINRSGQSNDMLGISVYPNPFTQDLNLTLNNVSEGDVTVEVFDLSGRKYLTQTQVSGQGTLTLDLSSLSTLAKGVYILNVRNAGTSLQQKMVKLQ